MDINKLIKEMKLKDKIKLLSGQDFWHTKELKKYNIKSIKMSDGPHGLRTIPDNSNFLDINKSYPSTCYPSASLSSCSFDENLLYELGCHLANEAKNKKVDIVLGPGVNIKRNPLCGRNFEYFSEDPYLAGILGGNLIKGIEENGIASSLKHFACNNQEYKRLSSSSEIDEKTLRDIYLLPFEIAIEIGKPSTVMCSYNKINGIYSSDNKKLLTDILRTEFKFDGLVVTDWGAMSNRVDAILAGCDLMMPGGSNYGEREIKKALKKNIITINDIDKNIERILKLINKTNHIDKEDVYNEKEHHQFSLKMAEESIVLLKNENVLPLKKEEDILFIGNMLKNPRYQGEGSSHINPIQLDNYLDLIKDYSYIDGYNEDGSTNIELLKEVEEKVKNKDKVVIICGLPHSYESEGYDRNNMKLPDGINEVIDTAIKNNENTIVVLCCGSSVELPWNEKVKGLIYAGLSGEAGSKAVINILFGKTNPSGRLAETWPVKYEDVINASYYGEPHKDALYKEGIYVGYRYFDKANIKVNYPFGYGLSYTKFKYSNLIKTPNGVKIKVKNIGDYDGKTSILMYIKHPDNHIYTPIKELKGFKKIYLKKNEEIEIEFKFDKYTFRSYQDGYVTLKGTYQILIGDQSINIDIEGIQEDEKYQSTWYETLKGIPTNQDFELLTKRKYQEKEIKKGTFTKENTLLEMKPYSLLVRIIIRILEKKFGKELGCGIDYNNPTFRMMIFGAIDSSLSNIQINGGLNDGLLQGVLDIANGKKIRGIRKIIFKR